MLSLKIQNQKDQFFTGFEKFDKVFGGICKNELVMISSKYTKLRMSYVLNVCLHNMILGKKVIYFSNHTSPKEIIGEINKINQKEYVLYQKNMNICHNFVMSANDIKYELCEKCKKEKLDFVIVDHLQFLAPNENITNFKEMIENCLKILNETAKELGIVIFVLSVFPIGIVREYSFDLKKEENIDKSIDKLVIIHNTEKEIQSRLEFVVIKNSNHNVGTLEYYFDYDSCCFLDNKQKYKEKTRKS